MRIIIAGSRTFDGYTLLTLTMDRMTRKLDKRKLVILSGHAKGADQLGEKWAFDNLIQYEVYRADWNKHGKKAGAIRNQEMVEKADALVAFWDGRSPGTRDVIERARKAGLKTKVVKT